MFNLQVSRSTGRFTRPSALIPTFDEKTRRRKVRCNEVRPRCSHCERLHLECQWRSTATTTSMRQTASPPAVGQRQAGIIDQPRQSTSTTTASLIPAVTVDGQFNDVFNYASFMWDGSDLWTGSPGWSGQVAEAVLNDQDYLIVCDPMKGVSAPTDPTSTSTSLCRLRFPLNQTTLSSSAVMIQTLPLSILLLVHQSLR